MQLNQQQFKYQISPTNGVTRTGGPKPNVPFRISPAGPMHNAAEGMPREAPKMPGPKRSLRQKLGDFNMRMWGQA